MPRTSSPEAPTQLVIPPEIQARYDDYAQRYGDRARSVEDWARDEGLEDQIGRMATESATEPETHTTTTPGIVNYEKGNQVVLQNVGNPQVHIGALEGGVARAVPIPIRVVEAEAEPQAVPGAAEAVPAPAAEAEPAPNNEALNQLREEFEGRFNQLQGQMQNIVEQMQQLTEQLQQHIEQGHDHDPPPPPPEHQPAAQEALDAAQLALANSRDGLVRLTIRRRGRAFERLTHRGRQDRENYESVLNNYNERFREYLRARSTILQEQGVTGDNLRLQLNHERFVEQRIFTQREVDINEENFQATIAQDGPRAWYARFMRRVANTHPLLKAAITAAAAGTAIALGPVGIGLGIGGVLAGGGLSFSWGLINRSASLRNREAAGQARELRRIQREETDSLLHLTGPADTEEYTGAITEANQGDLNERVRRAQRRNKIGRTIQLAGLASLGYGVAEAAGAPSVFGAFGGGHEHHGVGSGSGHAHGTTSPGSETTPPGTPGGAEQPPSGFGTHSPGGGHLPGEAGGAASGVGAAGEHAAGWHTISLEHYQPGAGIEGYDKGTVWVHAGEILKHQLGSLPSDSQTERAAQLLLNHNHLTWEQARDLPVGFRFQVPNEFPDWVLNGR